MPSSSIALALAAWFLLAIAGHADSPVHILNNGTLEARVMDPSHPERYNRGVRFTPLAAVLGVSRDGAEYLYFPEQHDPINDHAGLAAEFDLCIPGGPESALPSGYREAQAGEGFLKVGVGALKKPKTPYNFFMTPELTEAPETSVEWRTDGARFRQKFPGKHTPGYAYELEADLSLEGPSVIVRWRLRNCGTKPITTRQYTHNFLCIDGQKTGAGLALNFPYDSAARGLEKGQVQQGRSIRFLQPIPTWINAVVPYPGNYAGPNTVTLENQTAHRSIVCETSRPGLRTDIHARGDYVSPEQFIEIVVAPGETQEWTRRYTFLKEGTGNP